MNSLKKLCSIMVSLKKGFLINTDNADEELDSKPSNADTFYTMNPRGISFYSEVESKVEYTTLLNRAYLKTIDKSSENGSAKK